MPLRLIGKIPAAGVALKGAKLIDKADDAIKQGRVGTKAIDAGLKNANQIKGLGGNATRLAGADDWLKLTYKDVVNAGVDGQKFAFGMRTVGRTASQLTKGKASVRTVGEALGWGAFVAFNTAGEGNPYLDETATDMLQEFGLPTIPFLRTGIADTPLETKFKQMTEGLMLDPILSAFQDYLRIARFSKAFKNASAGEQRALVEVFNSQAEGLGASVARLDELAFEGPRPMQGPNAMQGPQAMQGPGAVPKVGPYREIDLALAKVDRIRGENQLAQETQANLLKQQQINAQVESQINQTAINNRPIRETSVGGTEQGMLPPGVQGGPLANAVEGVDVQDVTIQPVDVQVMRPPEPTVTPQTLRSGFNQYVRESFGQAGFEMELMEKTKRLMPRNRVDAIDLFTRFPLRFNGLGVMSAPESIANNYLALRGIDEGWIKVGPDMLLTYNRKLAFDFDRGEYALKQASALDEADEIARYNGRLQEGVTDPATQPVQKGLDPETADARKASNEYDDFEARPEGTGKISDPAIVEAKRREQLAAVEEAGAAADEQLRIDAVAAYGDIGSDRQVVAEMLNLDLDVLPDFQIEKVGNRRYQVLDDAGESIDGRNYSTLKAARKGSEIAKKEQAKAMVAKARAAAQRSADQQIPSVYGDPIVDSDLVRGTVTLTKRQGEVLADLGIPLNQLDLDLSQAELSGMSSSVRQLLESSSGSQRQVLNNILKRLDQKVTELGPAARMAMEVDRTITAAQQFLKNGEICY